MDEVGWLRAQLSLLREHGDDPILVMGPAPFGAGQVQQG
jgi:hypothetical protein